MCLSVRSHSPCPPVRTETIPARVAAFQVRGGAGIAAVTSRIPLLAMASSSAVVATNPLLEQQALPKFASIQPSDLTPAVSDLLEKMEADFQKLEEELEKSDTVQYDQTLPKVEQLQYPVSFVWGVAGHLNGVKNGDELRAAYEENQPKVVQSMTKISQSKALYNALSSLKLQQDSSVDNFEASQIARAVESSLRQMKLGGVGLEGEEKEMFNNMKMRLAELSTQFSNNVLDATKEFSLTVDDPSKVQGVPASAKAMWAQAHVQAQKEGEMDAENGPWRLTLDMPSYIAVMSHLPDRDLREKVYKASVTRASEFSKDKNNIPIIYEMLKIKDKMAKLLGFANYAERSLASKMAPSVAAVAELSNLIAEKALPAAKKELAEILALAKEMQPDVYGDVEKLMPWDTTYFSERLKEKKFDLTEEELRPFFALPNVLQGLFGLVERIFNIRVKTADGEAEVWHPDVRFFNVYDGDSDKHIASFYLDPYSRPENKRGGAWMDVCVGKSEALKKDIPVAYLTCNGSPPVGETPSLMSFREVETLFHEFGECLSISKIYYDCP
jgi:oligopeptidase A